MAYSNYEGKVFRDGEHFHDGCDATAVVVTPWGDDEPSRFMFQALLGDADAPVRVGLRKTSPLLLTWTVVDGFYHSVPLEGSREVEVGGFQVVRAFGHHIGNHAAVTMIDPDETVWTGMSGYEAWEPWCEEDRF